MVDIVAVTGLVALLLRFYGKMAAELLKLKQVRNGHRIHAKKLMDKSENNLNELLGIKRY